MLILCVFVIPLTYLKASLICFLTVQNIYKFSTEPNESHYSKYLNFGCLTNLAVHYVYYWTDGATADCQWQQLIQVWFSSILLFFSWYAFKLYYWLLLLAFINSLLLQYTSIRFAYTFRSRLFFIFYFGYKFEECDSPIIHINWMQIKKNPILQERWTSLIEKCFSSKCFSRRHLSIWFIRISKRFIITFRAKIVNCVDFLI